MGIGMNKVAIYIRWSTDEQSEGTTLDIQMDACRAYILSQGWVVSEELIYVDDGFSGGSLERPALARLRAAVSEGLVDCIVVYKLDRLSRSVVDMVRLVLDEWEGVCHVKSAREPIDTLTQTGRMFFYQLMSFAEWERSVIKERTYAGKLRRAREGKNPGYAPPYGYRIGDSGGFILVENEAVVVQLIYQLYLSGLGIHLVARRLNELGHLSPTGRSWKAGNITRMLSNPLYKGVMVWGREKASKGRKSLQQEAPYLIREGAAPVIIDTATWEAVQRVKEDRPGPRRKRGSGRSTSSSYLLTGLLKCRCGRSFFGTSPAKGVQYRYYVCTSFSSREIDNCDCGRIRIDLLDELVVKALMDEFFGQGKDTLLPRITARLQKDVREAQAAVDTVAAELYKVDAKEARLKALFLEGDMTLDEFRDLKADLNKQGARLREQHSIASIRLGQVTQALRDRQALAGRLTQVKAWQDLEQSQRKQLLRQFIAQILAYRDKQTGQVECAISWSWAGGETPAESVHTMVQSKASEAYLASRKGLKRGPDGRYLPKPVEHTESHR